MHNNKIFFTMRLISILVAVLMLPAINVFATEKALYESFEAYSTVYSFESGELSDCVSVQNESDVSSISFADDPQSAGNHGQTVKISDGPGGSYVYMMPYYGGAVNINPFSISFDFYADAASSFGEQFGIKLVTNDKKYANVVHFEDGQVYNNANTATGLGYTDKTWYNVEIQMDWKAQYIRINMKKAGDSEWQKKIITKASCFSGFSEDTRLIQIRMGYHKIPSGDVADFYIDNYSHFTDTDIKAPLYSWFDGYKTACSFDDDRSVDDYIYVVNNTGNSYADVVNFSESRQNNVLKLHHGGGTNDGNIYFMPYYNATGAGHPVTMSFDYYMADPLEMFVRLVLTNGQPLIFTFKNGTVCYGNGGSRSAVIVDCEELKYNEDCWYNVRIGVNWGENHVNLRIKKADDDTWTEVDMPDFAVLSDYSEEADALQQIRIGYYVSPGHAADLYIDNYTHITGGPGATEVVGIYAGKPYALVNGTQTFIAENSDVVPFFRNDAVMVPIEFFADSIDALYSIEDNIVTLSKESGSISVNTKTGIFTKNGITQPLSSSMEIKEETVFLPLSDLCKGFGYELFQDSSGLVFYTQKRIPLSWENDKKEILNLTESFIYDNVSGTDIEEKINLNTTITGDAHPRLIMTEQKFQGIRDEMAKDRSMRDPVIDKIYTKVKATADSYLNADLPVYKLDEIRLLDVSGEVEARVMNLAMMYNLTKYTDAELAEQYAETARATMLAAAGFADWNPYHFLDVALMSTGLAFGYDWLYDWMIEKGYTEDMEIIRNALCEKAFSPVMNDYNGTAYRTSKYTNDGRARSYQWNSEGSVNNWRFVVSGGLSLGALAIVDELEGDNLSMAHKVLSQSLLDIRPAISLFAPNGAYSEGLGYWGFANQYYQYHLGAMITATGTDFGYSDAPGLGKTASFVLAMNGPASVFNYHDSSRSKSSIPAQIMAWAKYFDNPAVAIPRINLILDYRGGIQDFLYYDKSFLNSTEEDAEKDSLFKEIGVFTARSGGSTEDIWIGFHADNPLPGSSHAHNDAGSFVLDAFGQNFFLDLGADDYNLENYSGGAYRTRAEGHNTIVINPSEHKYSDGTNDYYDQRYGSVATIDNCVMKPRGAFVKSNLTDVYADDVELAWRGMKLDDERRTVTVQDEIIMKAPSEFYWFAHTDAEIEIDETDGKTALLSKNGKTLMAQIVTADDSINPQFTVHAAVPLETSPQIEGQSTNDGINKLTIHIENCERVYLAVVFREYNEADTNLPTYTSLSDWSIPDGELPENDIQATAPILLDGMVKTNVTGLATRGKTVILLAALYKDNQLVEVLKTSQKIEKNSGEDLFVDLDKATKAYDSVRAFVWNETEGICPISNKSQLLKK